MRMIKFFQTAPVFLMFTLFGSSVVIADMQDLSGSFAAWRILGDPNWRVEEGAFVADAGNGQLVTADSFEDLHISLEFWVDESANSGVFLRAADPMSITDTSAYEVNIFDTRPDQTYRTGGVVHFAAPQVKIDTSNKWNTYDITMQGDHLTIILNGEITVDMHDSTYSEGPFSLQYGAGVVKFRNVKVERL
jgi:hypothetical protein